MSATKERDYNESTALTLLVFQSLFPPQILHHLRPHFGLRNFILSDPTVPSADKVDKCELGRHEAIEFGVQ